jgi:hypothetical protein
MENIPTVEKETTVTLSVMLTTLNYLQKNKKVVNDDEKLNTVCAVAT